MFRLKGLTVISLVAGVFLLAACGSGDQEPDPQQADISFATEMIPHHESAVEMAQIGQSEGERAEIRQLSKSIITGQQSEIDELEAAVNRIGKEESDSGSAGMSAEEMGMNMNPGDLEGAEPFDREFIDMMIPHHQGAIRMARIQLSDGKDNELRALAEQIITAQSAEIDQMNSWRTKWYGSPSPSGGVPPEDDSAHAGMDH